MVHCDQKHSGFNRTDLEASVFQIVCIAYSLSKSSRKEVWESVDNEKYHTDCLYFLDNSKVRKFSDAGELLKRNTRIW